MLIGTKGGPPTIPMVCGSFVATPCMALPGWLTVAESSAAPGSAQRAAAASRPVGRMVNKLTLRLGVGCAALVLGLAPLEFAIPWLAWTPRAWAEGPPKAADLSTDDPDNADTLRLTGLQDKFETLARRLGPTVVAISATTQPSDADDAGKQEDISSEKLEAMLERTTRMVGAGFIIDSDGYILTNQHVVGEAESIWITTDQKKVYPAIVMGSDPRSDLAVVKIAAKDLPAIRFAPYGSVRRGQWAIAMGNPYGLSTLGETSMSVGIISAKDRALPQLSRKENRLYTNLIQTTAQINPGNSGGPLFDLAGEVVGVNTAVILPEKRANGIGFAMPITPQTVSIVQDLKEGREIAWSYLGVMVSTPSDHERRQAGINSDCGVRIDNVEADSPALCSGQLKAQDFIVEVNGQLIGDSDEFVRIIGAAPPEKEAKLTLYRSGKPLEVGVTLGRRPTSLAAVTRARQRFHWQGMLLGPIPANWDFGHTERPPDGLMVLSISDDSPFHKQKIVQGDVITTVAGKTVPDVTTLQQILSQTPADQCSLSIAGRSDAVVDVRQ